METPSNYGKDETSHNKTVETTVPSLYFTPHNSTIPVHNQSANTSVDSRGSKVDDNICSFYESEKFDCTASTALVEEICNNTKSRVLCDNVKCDGDGGNLDKNQTFEDKQNRYCSCPYERMSEADTEYLDFTPASPLKCSNFDENCFCHTSDVDMSSTSGVNIIKRQYSTNRRMIKIRIKTSSSKECSVEGESTENGIKICISPRRMEETYKSNRKCALNETYSITGTSEIESSSRETDYEFRNNIKNELRRSPAAVKVLNYLESLSEARKKSPENSKNNKKRRKQRPSDPKPVIETVPSTIPQTKSRRSKSGTPPKRVPTPTSVDDDEFHDCCDKTTFSESLDEYEDTTESFDTSQGFENCSKSAPLITITQEMSTEMVVTSKFEINKEKLKRMNEQRERRQSKESRESPDKIIDDNFCNEIIDKMNQLKESFKEASRHEDENETDDDSILKIPLDTTLDTSNASPGPQKPPRTFAYRRSQENRPKSPKQAEIRLSLESLDMYLYEEMKQLKLFKFNQSRKQIHPVLDEGNYIIGGWKVSPNKGAVAPSPVKSPQKQNIGWTNPVQYPKKVAPGWIQQPSNASVPPDIVNMLHYSDDEVKRANILSFNARAEPQQRYPSSSEKPLGPKIDIDTVDAAIHTPSSSSNQRFEEFANNTRARSTPRRKETGDNKKLSQKLEPYLKFKRTKDICKKFLEMERGGGDKSSNPLPSVEQFLQSETGKNEVCKNCCREINPKRAKFHERAFKRTKSLFVASKKKIDALKKDKMKSNEVLSDSDPYCTPENTPHKYPTVPKRRSSLSLLDHSAETINIQDKVLPPVPTEVPTKTFNYNAPLPQSPQRPLLEVTPPKKSPLNLKISPKRLFGMGNTSTQTSPIQIPREGGYKSFVDQEENLAATMGEILAQLRTIIEGNATERTEQITRDRKISTSSELLDHDRPNNQLVNVLLHNQEPEYIEISPTHAHYETLKKISPQIERIEHNNNEYIIVNNDPRAIYATVRKTDNPNVRTPNSHYSTPTKPIRKKKARTSRRRITFNVQPSNALHTCASVDNNLNKIKKLSNSCSSLHDSKTMDTKNISKNLFGSDQCVKVSAKVYDLDFARKYRVTHEKYQKHADQDFEKEVQQIAYDTNIMDQYLESLTNILNKKLVVDDKNVKKATEDFLMKEIDVEREDNLQRNAKHGDNKQDEKTCHDDHLSTGGTYKSYGYPRPDTQRSDDYEQSFSLNYSSGDVDSHNNDAGYDVVDFKPYKDPMIIRTNEIEEIICEEEFDQYFNSDEKRQVTSLDDTLTTTETHTSSSGSHGESSAQPSPIKPSRRGSLYRSFKDSLRTSFRKGRNFIKHEQDKLVQLFDKHPGTDGKNALPKPARSFVNLDEYKKYYNDQNGEQIYKNWCEKLTNAESNPDLHDKRMLELINLISAQRQIKKQLRNALEICRCSKEFDSSSELIEAERLLLVSNLKEAAAKKELMAIENDVYADVKQTVNNIGMIALSDFEFPLKDAAMYDTLYNYFYVCVATYKDQVKASYAKERQGTKVSFRGFEIKFWDVEPDYQIKIEVYVLCLRKNNRGATESRFNSTKNAIKMSPRRFFKGNPVEKSPNKRYDPDLEFSQFKSQGFMFITSSSFISYSESLVRRQIPDANIDLPYYSSSNFHQYLKKSGDHYINCVEDYRSFRMHQMIYNSHMTGELEMAIKSEVVFDGSKMTGFLTVGESINGSIIWNRRWCKIEGLCLNFWNYPQEATTNPPVEVIDIAKCENDYIYQADRAICPRPRTIVIEQADASTTIDARPGYFFLSTDNKQELRDWLRELNKILRFVRDWKL